MTSDLELRANEPSESSVLVTRTGPDTALVVGEPLGVSRLGATIDVLPQAVLRATALGNAAVQAALGAGELSGHLVRLTSESVAALNKFGSVTDSAGAVLGVVRDSNGQFAKVLRFTPADGVAAIASVGPALAAVALQLQLQQISRQLVRLDRAVGRVEAHQLDELANGISSSLQTLRDAFQEHAATGVISDTEWSKIASLTDGVLTRAGQTRDRLSRVTDGLADIRRNGTRERSATDRVNRLQAVEEQHPSASVHLYVSAQEAAVLYEYLHIHRLVTTQDPHIERYRGLSEARVSANLREMQALLGRFESARVDAMSGDLSSWNPWRHLVDKAPLLRLKLLEIKDGTDATIRTVQSVTLAVAGDSDRISIPAAPPM